MYLLNKLLRKLAQRALPAPTDRQRALIEELRDQIRSIDQGDANGGSAPYWLSKRRQLRQKLLSEDPRLFQTFPVITETMFIDAPPYLAHEYDQLKGSSEWSDRWRPALHTSDVLRAPPCPYYPGSTGSNIHHAYHILEFEKATSLRAGGFQRIFEFGGGFGGMCRLVHRLGFAGRYFIYDFPEFGALQRFYLSMNDIPLTSFDSTGPGATCFSEDSRIEHAFVPAQSDLFIASWSLSETPLDFRRRVLEKVKPSAWLIGFQDYFDGFDNLEFFSEWTRANPRWQWKLTRIAHHPGQQQYYLFGNEQRR
jgi:hypothetical protein